MYVCRAGDDSSRNGAHVADLGELEQSPGNGFHHLDSLNLTTSQILSLPLSHTRTQLVTKIINLSYGIGSTYNGNIKASNASVASSNLHFGGITNVSLVLTLRTKILIIIFPIDLVFFFF